ncbi:hypothetical protein C8A03DRAFT_29150 [Achaetomium macrosporum]|uniref:Uncharacterized protein n=1 Tax=Achaetomium macrosporum TaxID=79813 RepID=A0AAN7CJ37_9PEZI|nr:hypothetical protein C8A03DRAFT_29150 [Achaetomium macrosporum]
MESLFGGDDGDDLPSLLTGVGAVPPPQEPDCAPASVSPQERPKQAANHSFQLSFPKARSQDEPDRQPSCSTPQLYLPAVPDPPAASLSQQDGHTSGDFVVSTQDSALSCPGPAPATAPHGEFLDDAALEEELEGLWDSIQGEVQPVNAHAGSQDGGDVQGDSFILPSQIPGHRYANCQTNASIRLPRRIDHDQKLALALTYFITLSRTSKIETLYDYLELGIGEGKRLGREIRKLLKEPPLSQLIDRPGNGNSGPETKRTLINISFYLLVTEGWGEAWFGESCSTASSRTLFWPTDSSILLSGFVILLYRCFANQRQMHQAALRVHARYPDSNTNPTLSPSPSRSATAETVISPATPPPTPEPQGQAIFEALAKDVAAAKKRKHAEAILDIASQEAYDLELPPNAKLKYYVYVKDKTDGTDLAPPTKYRHTDYIISHGAFSCLKSSFEAAGHDPIFEIQTPFERKSITSEEEWEHAVLSIYNVRRSGGVVEVDVFV